MALGATPASLRCLVLAESAKLALFGLAAGVPAVLFSTRSLSTLLLGVTPFDPLTFIGVAFLLTLGALAAGFFPARRATRVDPIRSLHDESLESDSSAHQ
jgi:putative ABC transport system permease protein